MIGLTREALLANDWHALPYWKVLVKHRSADDDEYDLAEFHLQVSTRMAMHLSLTTENFMTMDYCAAGMLSADPARAQEAACIMRDHILRKPIRDMSGLERDLRTDNLLWAQLDRFADLRPPAKLWRGRGAFRDLFAYLAVRFLTARDSVLGSESIHSRWQHLLRAKHSIKHPLLNSILKTSYMLTDGVGMPSAEELLPHFSEARREHSQQYIDAIGRCATGYGRQEMYVNRFNIGGADVLLLKGPRVGAGIVDGGPEVRWVDRKA